MYVTQTFLGTIAKDAKFYVYFLTEGYAGQQQRHLYEEVTKRIAEFGLSTGPSVAVVMPHPGSEVATLGEVRDNTDSPVQKFYRAHIQGETPGLLVTLRPISERNAHEGAIFFSLANVEHPFRESKTIVQNVAEAAKDNRFWSMISSFNRFVKMEPNVFGVGFNLNRAIDFLVERKSRGHR